jgi:hypothetical protein
MGCLLGESSFVDWQNRGKDPHPNYTNPMFMDARKRDSPLRPDSPALAKGFEEFDVTTAGT